MKFNHNFSQNPHLAHFRYFLQGQKAILSVTEKHASTPPPRRKKDSTEIGCIFQFAVLQYQSMQGSYIGYYSGFPSLGGGFDSRTLLQRITVIPIQGNDGYFISKSLSPKLSMDKNAKMPVYTHFNSLNS